MANTDNEIATHEEMLPHVERLAEAVDDIVNSDGTGRGEYVRRAAASLMAQRLWALVSDLEDGKPVCIIGVGH